MNHRPNDIGHPPIAIVFEILAAECPVCSTAVIAHRMLGVRSASGMRWFCFYPHRAPCGQRCAAGGVIARKIDPDQVHTGPTSCHKCDHGTEEAPNVNLVLIPETKDTKLLWEKAIRDGDGDTDAGPR